MKFRRFAKMFAHRKANKTMKTKMKAELIAGVAGLTATTMLAQSTNSAEMVQYSAKVTMSNTGADTATTGASGTVQATESTSEGTKHNSEKESLNITAKGLDAGTDYSIATTLSGSSTSVGTA